MARRKLFPTRDVAGIVNVLEKAADAHGEDSGIDYTIGDHLDSLRVAIAIMTPVQRNAFCAEREEAVREWL